MQGLGDLYETLQVHPSAEPDVIRAAYRRLVLRYHPDQNKSSEALVIIKRLIEAYEILSDPTQRARYDQSRTSAVGSGAVSDTTTTNQQRPKDTKEQPHSNSERDFRKGDATPLATFQSRAKYGLRWLAVLPVGILAAGLIMFPVHWVVLLVTSVNDGGIGLSSVPPETLERLAYALINPLSLVYFGAWAAPAYRLYTSVALGMLVAAGIGASWTFSLSSGLYDYAGWSWIWALVAVALNFGGLISGVFLVRKHYGLGT